MYDTRLLTLFKQHYRDVYDEPLISDYTCWGYYDGMDISENIPFLDPEEILLPICPEAPIPTLWYYTGEKVSKLKGNFSAQNIGLIRYLSEDNKASTTDFWNENSRMPFFAVAFLQISDRLNFTEISNLIERTGSTPDIQPISDPFCRAIAYGSFDNTDIVLLLHSNSLFRMEKALRDIEELPEVRYIHSIAGVSESYLKKCVEADPILPTFDGIMCFLDEVLPEVQINVVTDGTPEVVEYLKSQLTEWQGKSSSDVLREAAFFSKNGHETFVIVLRNIPVSDMLRLFVTNGIGTHQNCLYGQNVFNIATSLLFNQKAFQDFPARAYPHRQPRISSRWCKNLIKRYRSELIKAIKQKDESLASYYQAIFQTLNTLSQYEQFSLSGDIFLALIPSFKMFTEQFQASLHSPDANRISIKESLRDFLDYANLVIYHTIHTDQMFLMVPGYSGTSFSIPIKLTLLFLWFSWKLIQILNDSNNVYKCILTPVMESRPFTHLIDFGTSNHNRLIAIKVSQRLLYTPQYLTIILSHEIAHYVGEALRNRQTRLEHLANLLAYYVGERLLPCESEGAMPELRANIYRRYRQEISYSLGEHLSEAVNHLADGDAYANDCIYALCKSCRSWLVRQIDPKRSLILNLPEGLEQELRYVRGNYTDLMQFLRREQDNMSIQLQSLLCSNDCDAVIDEMFSISREIFSDIVALIILNCPQRDFEDAFLVSEGVAVDRSALTSSQWFRQDIVARVVFNTGGLASDTYYLSRPRQDDAGPREDLYKYNGMKIQFTEYAQDCCKLIRQRISQPDISPLVDEVQNFYHLFAGQCDTGDIYAQMTRYIHEYEISVKSMLNEGSTWEI